MSSTQQRNVRIFSQRLQSIKQLSGFRKGSKLPDAATDSANKWVATMAEGELDADLQQTLDLLRANFKFKRREIQIAGPIDGLGTITTPFFTYQITVQVSTEDSAQVVWCRELQQISEIEKLLTPEFDECFPPAMWTLQIPVQDAMDIEDVIDNIEDAENDAITIHYDKDCTWCDVRIKNVPGTLRVTENAFEISPPSSIKPKQVFESLLAMRSKLGEIQSFDSFQS